MADVAETSIARDIGVCALITSAKDGYLPSCKNCPYAILDVACASCLSLRANRAVGSISSLLAQGAAVNPGILREPTEN